MTTHDVRIGRVSSATYYRCCSSIFSSPLHGEHASPDTRAIDRYAFRLTTLLQGYNCRCYTICAEKHHHLPVHQVGGYDAPVVLGCFDVER